MGPSDGNLVGIVGAGRLGQAMARTARRAGRDVVIANSRGPESLTSVVSALGEGVSSATVDEAAGAGIPSHLHVHVLPRWNADSNFMTAVAEARVLPESLGDSWAKLRAAWPAPGI